MQLFLKKRRGGGGHFPTRADGLPRAAPSAACPARAARRAPPARSAQEAAPPVRDPTRASVRSFPLLAVHLFCWFRLQTECTNDISILKTILLVRDLTNT